MAQAAASRPYSTSATMMSLELEALSVKSMRSGKCSVAAARVMEIAGAGAAAAGAAAPSSAASVSSGNRRRGMQASGLDRA